MCCGANSGAIMNQKRPTATLFLDTRKQKSNGKFPVKLTIYSHPQKKRYSTGIDLTEDEWNKINGQRLKDDRLRDLKMKITSIVTKAEKVLEKLSPFSFIQFEAEFFKNAAGKANLSLEHWFKEYISQLEAQGREGTRISYQTTFNSFNVYKKNLCLPDITKEFLQGYEAHMTKLGKSSSTIGIYLRQLRTIINQAIEKGCLKQESYPFKGFDVPGARNVKKALTDAQLKTLLNYIPADKNKMAFDFWIFSYLCNGMNFTDIAHLTPGNINGNFLHFIRRKTIRTKKKDLRPIKMALHPMANSIIEKWKNAAPGASYLFPILDKGLSPKTVKHRIQRFIKKVNASMEEIRQELGFDCKLNTYAARHSFSSRLMRAGASTQYIKDSLGHSSVAVTENYLGDFDDSVKSEFSNLLTGFES